MANIERTPLFITRILDIQTENDMNLYLVNLWSRINRDQFRHRSIIRPGKKLIIQIENPYLIQTKEINYSDRKSVFLSLRNIDTTIAF